MAKKTREEKISLVLEAFKRQFPTLEDARKNIHRLTAEGVKAVARGRPNWVAISKRLFIREEGKPGSWYDDCLPNIAYRLGWFSSLEEARQLSEEARAIGKASRSRKLKKARLNLGEEEILEIFTREFPSLEEARKNPERLGYKAFRDGRKELREFLQSARSIYTKADGKPGRWYENVLPNLMLRAGWFETMESAREFAEEVRKCMDEKSREIRSNKQRHMNEEELIEAFKAEFPSLEEARKDLWSLTAKQVSRALGKEKNWLSSARGIYRQPNGRLGRWDEEVLPNVLLKAGWLKTLEEGREFAREVREFCERAAGRKPRMTEEEIIAYFRRLFPSLEEAKKDPATLGRRSIIESQKKSGKKWVNTVGYRYKTPDGKPGRWFEQVLPTLMLKAGWFATAAEAEAFALEAQAAGVKRRGEAYARNRRGMSRTEILKAFLADFPSLEEAKKDLTKLGHPDIRSSYKAGKCSWYLPACSLFRRSRSLRFYDDILPNLVLEAGWYRNMEEARAFAQDVKGTVIRASKKKIWKSRKTKSERRYAIVVGTLQNAKRSASFEGIPLELLDTEESEAIDTGMARLHLSRATGTGQELTPAQLVRLKMSTEDWGGEVAKAYSESFAMMAPYLTTRLLLLHALRLSLENRLFELETGVSFMSGPGEVYGALEDLRDEIESWGLSVPTVIDVDAEKDMLGYSGNPQRIRAVLPDSPFSSGSLGFVENSSLYQFDKVRHPTLVKDVLIEAKRVLKAGGALLLTSAAKRFGKEFEIGLRRLGFDIVMPANTTLNIPDESQKRIFERMGPEVLDKAVSATRHTFYLIAVKSNRAAVEAPPDIFRFERVKAEASKEAKGMAALAKGLDRKIEESDEAAEKSMVALLRILEDISPEGHRSHARLIQSVISRFMLDPAVIRPDDNEEKLEENAKRLADELSMDIKGAGEKYMRILKWAAQTHRNRLMMSKKRRELS